MVKQRGEGGNGNALSLSWHNLSKWKSSFETVGLKAYTYTIQRNKFQMRLGGVDMTCDLSQSICI
jgi:hypothetical protein